MNVDRKLDPVAVDASNSSDVVKVIEAFESSIQVGMGKEFAHLSQDVFKNMRRVLPITKTKVKWETIAGCESLLCLILMKDKIKDQLNQA
jgi:capping protein alpha